ncbi:MAG: ATP phosphoribosyltransferase [Proteobacteria bacterium]|nr:ATP phosphoribosyltransferase [Pseudomonadota bacterium]
MTKTTKPLVISIPKGRILEEISPLFKKVGLIPEKAFFDESSRKLRFSTNQKNVELIRVRSFDVPTFVAFGAAQIGIAGSDVLNEFDYPDLYTPVDLNVGKCRMSVAAPAEWAKDKEFLRQSHIRVATKYPNTTKRYFAAQGIQAECIKLNGALELAPTLGLCRRIVDLVSSGATLKANGLEETDVIAQVSSRLIVNRVAFKTRSKEINAWIKAFQKAVEA